MKAFKIATPNKYSIVDLDKLVILEMQADKGMLNFENGAWVQCSLAEAKEIERGIGYAQEACIWRVECVLPIEILIPTPEGEKKYKFEEGDLVYKKSYGYYLKPFKKQSYILSEEQANIIWTRLHFHPNSFVFEDYRNDND